jgi:hypothetical protein
MGSPVNSIKQATMRILSRIAVVILVLAGGVLAQQNRLPRFEDFPASEEFKGKVAPVKLSSARARKFRTVLKENASKGVNFAGHYVIATWGCGADCLEFAIIDARTGRVYFTPSLLTVAGLPDQKEDRLQFRKDSRLLIVVGARNEEGGGKYYYEWKNNQLELRRSVETNVDAKQ